ncbi:MAG: MBL fold metallo-hydrolase [Actinomycetota bacterium]|nr:MBL fold metallo-hydrolase [Actinomycetota bacterium]
MLLTKFTHACVRLDDGDRSLVIDPGSFSEVEEALDGVHGVLITHEHADHVDAEALARVVARDSSLRIWAPSAVAVQLDRLGDHVTTVAPGESFVAAGFEVTTHGGQHALIHSSIPVVVNVGFCIDGRLFHPGDSLEVPAIDVDTLLVPVHAPWSSVGQVIDYLIGVGPRQAYNLHDGLLNERGRGTVTGHLQRQGARHGVGYRPLEPREEVSL